MNHDHRRYRVFVSYSHEDGALLDGVTGHLRDLGLQVRWSGTLLPGMRFAEQIKDGIARAHLFVPILTKSASERPWVHHEIGYAVGLNVPVLPLAVGDLPKGMVEELQALPVRPDFQDLPQQLTIELIEQLVLLAPDEGQALFQHAEYHEDRTRMLVDAARKVLRLDGPVPIRQLGALSSFSLPDVTPTDPFWARCDGCGAPRSDALRRDLSRERQLLEDHARSAGCRLVIEPRTKYGTRGEAARRARLETLIRFLEEMPDQLVTIVLADAPPKGNSLMIGDWYLAESISPIPSRGYVQTLGTWHAPTILSRMCEFDRYLERLLTAKGLDGRSSRRAALDELHAYIETLPQTDDDKTQQSR